MAIFRWRLTFSEVCTLRRYLLASTFVAPLSRIHMMADVICAAGMLVYRHRAGQIEYLLLQASYPPYHWSPPKGCRLFI